MPALYIPRQLSDLTGSISTSQVTGLDAALAGKQPLTDTMVSTAVAPLTLKSYGTPGTYTATASGIFMYNATGVEMLRIVATDPDQANYNSSNLYIGTRAGFSQPSDNTSSGYFNLGIGYETLYSITTGTANFGIGSSALHEVTTGYSNVAVGSGTLGQVVGGYGNIGIGQVAGYSSVNGNNNVFIGHMANSSSGDVSSCTAIGAHTSASGTLAVAVGSGSTAADTSVCVGGGSSSVGNSIALGPNVTVSNGGSIAIGVGATTNAIQQLVFGSASYPINLIRLPGGKAKFEQAVQLPVLTDAAAPSNSIFFGSDHPDTNGDPKLCRKGASAVFTIGF